MFVQNRGYERQEARQEYSALGKLRRPVAIHVAKDKNYRQKREEENDRRIGSFGGITFNQVNENCCCSVNRLNPNQPADGGLPTLAIEPLREQEAKYRNAHRY